MVFWSGVVGPGAFARSLARASRSLSRYALKSSTCEQVYYSQVTESAFFPRMKNLQTKKTSNGSNFGWLIRQMLINQKSGRKTFCRRFVSGSLFVSPCPPECNFKSETKKEPDLRLMQTRQTFSTVLFY